MIRFKGHFDGEAIVPDEPVEIPTGRTYTVSLAEVEETETNPNMRKEGEVDALAEILAMATNLGPPDLSINFRKYTGRVLDSEDE